MERIKGLTVVLLSGETVSYEGRGSFDVAATYVEPANIVQGEIKPAERAVRFVTAMLTLTPTPPSIPDGGKMRPVDDAGWSN